ncbi:peroxiredoxin-like family protein [Elizabethkingia anophelis]|uniref:peroxiredoxin-like family protein n=1 Tax=Elizabethkingia anophelis TaxID=1117645 RepID=UPI0016253249|nr:peroxiredoxin-like family protein [Elizabethkingia anophelis]MDV4116283.1 antioxidant AhpC [Elizabethkingia anophelis]
MTSLIKVLMGVFSFSWITGINAQIPKHPEDIRPLLIGENLPDAKLVDNNGKEVNLLADIKKKPTVLVFYRGGWCPYCNMQLSGLVKIEKDILDLGYQIIAVSPDDYRNLQNMEEKDSIHYKLLSDPDGKFISKIGIAFQTPLMIKGFAATKGQKGKMSDVIPVPTVMVVDTNGKILFEYINPNYQERLSGKMLLAVLKTIE